MGYQCTTLEADGVEKESSLYEAKAQAINDLFFCPTVPLWMITSFQIVTCRVTI